MLQCTIVASNSAVEREQLGSPEIHEAESRRRMSFEHPTKDRSPPELESPFRRKLLVGTAAVSASVLLPPLALAQQFPTA
jgi:hypothetical protein